MLYDENDSMVRIAAEGILGGANWLQRWIGVEVRTRLEERLGKIIEFFGGISKILFVAHSSDGKFIGIPRYWWDGVREIQLFAFGCRSYECHGGHALDRAAIAFLGYSCDVEFYIGTERGRRAMRRVLRGLGRAFFRADSLDERLEARLRSVYDSEIDRVLGSYQALQGDRVVLLLLGLQARGLKLVRED